jgi:hypothetical protein
MSTVLEIEQAIAQLPAAEMLEIARKVESHVRARLDDQDSGELSPAWLAELDARVRHRQHGETPVRSREEVHNQLRMLLD